MANIRLERKQGLGGMAILGIAVVAALLLLWYLGTRDAAGDDVLTMSSPGAVLAPAPTAAGDPSSAIGAYLAYVERPNAQDDFGAQHEYTATAIRRLAAALDAAAARETVSGMSIDTMQTALRQKADALQRDATSAEHARYARDAFVAAATLMSAIQQGAYPDARGAVEDARAAALAIQQDEPLLEQRDAVQRFLDRAGVALQRLQAENG
jgi:hypothetical protein